MSAHVRGCILFVVGVLMITAGVVLPQAGSAWLGIAGVIPLLTGVTILSYPED